LKTLARDLRQPAACSAGGAARQGDLWRPFKCLRKNWIRILAIIGLALGALGTLGTLEALRAIFIFSHN
jgi:hypothetical protein